MVSATQMHGEQLVHELLADSTEFFGQGKAYHLLQDYFDGFPVETLRPLLANTERMVRRAAVWVASELGGNARSLIDDVIPLIRDADRYIQYYALEVVMVCSFGENVNEFMHVAGALESTDAAIRILAMRLVSNAQAVQLEAALRLVGRLGVRGEIHKRCLSDLLEGRALGPQRAAALLNDKEALVRRYGAVAARRLSQEFPELLGKATSVADPDVRQFMRQ